MHRSKRQGAACLLSVNVYIYISIVWFARRSNITQDGMPRITRNKMHNRKIERHSAEPKKKALTLMMCRISNSNHINLFVKCGMRNRT